MSGVRHPAPPTTPGAAAGVQERFDHLAYAAAAMFRGRENVGVDEFYFFMRSP